MKILGIDPGYDKLGVAVVEKLPKEKEKLIYSACLKTNKSDDYFDRLKELGESLEKIIEIYKPEVLSIEKLFFTTNQKTAMRVSEVRGMIIYLAKKNNLKIFEYTPLQVKSTIAGFGRADKAQVIMMVPKLIVLKKEIKEDDEYDAIALALTCLACEPLQKLCI
ncbi:MAG: crossover junction endodeoxyribonuclease RuvC [Patescibacteria group bacterium]